MSDAELGVHAARRAALRRRIRAVQCSALRYPRPVRSNSWRWCSPPRWGIGHRDQEDLDLGPAHVEPHPLIAFRAVSPAPHQLPFAQWRGQAPCNGAVPVADPQRMLTISRRSSSPTRF